MKILIATDGSEFSDAAVKKTCRLIKNPKNTEIKVVAAYDQPILVAAAPFALPVQYNENFDKELHEQANRIAAKTEQQICDLMPELQGKVESKVLCGAAAQAIVEEAEESNADLIVVGTHGCGFWERTILGSVSASVVHHAPCSVLVVRERSSGNVQN